MTPSHIWKPNIIVLAAIGGTIVYIAGGDTTLAGALVGGIVTTMFMLGGPPPNPKMSKEIVMSLIAATTHTDVKTAATMDNRDRIVIGLIVIASIVTCVLAYSGHLAGEALSTVAGGLVGAIVTLAGKLVDPGDDDTATQAVAMELIDVLRSNKISR